LLSRWTLAGRRDEAVTDVVTVDANTNNLAVVVDAVRLGRNAKRIIERDKVS
jgi:hypothetical protein